MKTILHERTFKYWGDALHLIMPIFHIEFVYYEKNALFDINVSRKVPGDKLTRLFQVDDCTLFTDGYEGLKIYEKICNDLQKIVDDLSDEYIVAKVNAETAKELIRCSLREQQAIQIEFIMKSLNKP